MLFKIQAVFMLEILALVASSFLIMLGGKQECCKAFYKIIGSLSLLVSLASFSCTVYHTYKYAKLGILEMHDPGMMQMGLTFPHPMMPPPESGPSHGCTP